MEGVIITEAMIRYAEECEKANVTARQPPLSEEEMRAQVQRIHEEGLRRHQEKKEQG
jgi:hypothetical protein